MSYLADFAAGAVKASIWVLPFKAEMRRSFLNSNPSPGGGIFGATSEHINQIVYHRQGNSGCFLKGIDSIKEEASGNLTRLESNCMLIKSQFKEKSAY